MTEEPLATITPIKGLQKSWPIITNSDYRPLAGIRVVDLSRVIAAPTVCKLLAILGADVIKISFHGLPDFAMGLVDLNTGKRDVDIDLKTEDGRRLFEKIIKDADVLVDGYRPKALEKLGFPSARLREINQSLIYLRENCYGWKGPWSHRSGWQQISDCVVGLSWVQGKFLGLNEPVVPILRKSESQDPNITLTNRHQQTRTIKQGLLGRLA
jgi:crotonobetainyl-CoA:carnitine CoA-transferase CaiB-like acyl-CoA transferase